MSIRITFEGDSSADLQAAMFEYLGVRNPAYIAPEEIPLLTPPIEQPVTAKRGRKPKAAAPDVVDSLPATPTPAATATPVAAAPVTPATPLGPDAVAPGGAVFLAVKAFNDKHGMEKARELLAKFGAGMVRQIKPSDYEAVITACAA